MHSHRRMVADERDAGFNLGLGPSINGASGGTPPGKRLPPTPGIPPGACIDALHTKLIGYKRGPVLVTVHDIGLDPRANFEHFFSQPSAVPILRTYSILNIAISESANMDENPFPTSDELCKGLIAVLDKYHVEICVGIGYGFGAHLLSMLAIEVPLRCAGLIFFNHVFDGDSGVDSFLARAITCAKEGFDPIVECLLSYHDAPTRPDFAEGPAFVRKLMAADQASLAGLIEACLNRGQLQVDKLRCPLLYVVGKDSFHAMDSRQMHDSRCMNASDQLQEVPNCTMPLLERPETVSNAVISFLQTIGYVGGVRGILELISCNDFADVLASNRRGGY